MRRIHLSGVVSLALMASVTVAQADDGLGSGDVAFHEVAELQIEDSISDAELDDLHAIANQEGLTLDDAIERYAWNDNFAHAVSKIREAFPEIFAGAEIVDAQRAWVAFADSPSDGALEIIDDFTLSQGSVAVEVRTDLGFTEVDLESAITTVHYTVFDRAEVRDASTSFDFETREISVIVALDSGVPDSVIDDLRAAASDKLIEEGNGAMLDSVAVSVVRSSRSTIGGLDSGTEHLGGESLSSCTSGFVIRNSANTRHVATAGHCPPPDGNQSDDGVLLPLQATHEGAHGDFQRHSGTQPRPDDFYSGNANATEVNRRDVAAVGAPVVGQPLCKNGKTNHKQCQDVRKLGVCHSVYCNLVQMEARIAAGGDSGGPVYWGNTAYGLHQGWHFDLFPFDRDLFSRADRIDNAFPGWNVANT